MTEIDKQSPLTVEGIKQEFRSHLLSVEFGSPDYLAFCDLYALEQQKYHLRIEIGKRNGDPSIEGDLLSQSQLRITESRIALIENDIEYKKVTDIDYSKAYDRVEETMGKLWTAISNENMEEGSDRVGANQEIEDAYHDILVNDFKNVLYRFYK